MDIVRPDTSSTRRRRLGVWLVVAAVFVTGGALALARQKPAAPPLARSQAWIDTVRRGPLSIQVHASGVLTPVDVEWISATSEGLVERVFVLPGTAVTAETELMRIQNPELQQSTTTAELELRAAEAELKNRRNQVESTLLSQEAVVAAVRSDYEEARLRAAADADLARNGLISSLTLKFSQGRESQLAVRVTVEERRLALARQNRDSDIASVAARVEQLRALVSLRHQMRDGLKVRSIRTGVVQQVLVEPGQRVTSGAVLARVAAPEPLKAVLQVSEVHASQIAAGQKVDVDTHNGVVSGVVARIDPAVRNGSVIIDVHLPRELPAGARPDLSVDATITVAQISDALFVGRPVQASANADVALFRLDGTARSAVRTRVRIGRASYNAVEVLDGLSAGDRVILSDTSAFDRFDRVTITD